MEVVVLVYMVLLALNVRSSTAPDPKLETLVGVIPEYVILDPLLTMLPLTLKVSCVSGSNGVVRIQPPSSPGVRSVKTKVLVLRLVIPSMPPYSATN